jgi:LAO/AO transport system kinase
VIIELVNLENLFTNLLPNLAATLATSLIEGNRASLAKAITLAESQKNDDLIAFQKLLAEVLAYTGKSIRLGITGAPGVGKSTFIESFGGFLTSLGKRVAVLSIDPSSPISGGSILGDKTRMEKLSKDPLAFIRPSASRSFPGGVAHATRESILLCEAAGFEVIIVETVGVGQSEFSVKDMCDCFLLLMLAGAGDELQGIKKGIMEMADIVAITKADGDNMKRAQNARAEFQHALHLIRPAEDGWSPKIVACSAIDNTGIQETWNLVSEFISHQISTRKFERTRQSQQTIWLNEQLNAELRKKLIRQNQFGEKWNLAVAKIQSSQWTVFEAVNFLTTV